MNTNTSQFRIKNFLRGQIIASALEDQFVYDISIIAFDSYFDMFNSLSEPKLNYDKIWSFISDNCKNFIEGKIAQQFLLNGSVTCNASNNPPDLIKNDYVNVNISFKTSSTFESSFYGKMFQIQIGKESINIGGKLYSL